ncbi:MAG: anthranilate synthase component I family protein [Synechococcaceae cyanobacterium]|jgi:para-aminobenzoate synthetase component 1
MERRQLAWRDPWALCRALASELGHDGLVLLDGDASPLGNGGVLGVDPLERLRCQGLPGDAGAEDPFGALEAAATPAGGGGWLGWLSYEAGAWVEPGAHWRRSDMASLWAGRYDPLVHFRRRERRLWLEGHNGRRLAALADRIERACPAGAGEPQGPAGPGLAQTDWHWHTSPQRYAAQVEQLRTWIAAGDLFQANLTACCEQLLAEPPDPLALYGRLRRHCPAPFAGLAVAGQEAVLSASPERFLRLGSDGWVETRPIKGTRPRDACPDADAASAADLVSDPKDRAENVMIVDLLRNDLGRVCRPGSITVPQLVGLESYAQVHHLTSVVTGRLRPGLGVVELLRACWPGGSITGAPKVRASQRLSGLEPVPRGPYCGSLFHLGADGSFDSSILIRTLLLRDRRLRAHAGGGIVADSDPAAEAEEMGWKIRPLLEALT